MGRASDARWRPCAAERRWLRSVTEAADAAAVPAVVTMAAVARALAESGRSDLDPSRLRLGALAGGAGGPGAIDAIDVAPPPPAVPAPDVVGRCYELLLTDRARRAEGSHYTPATVADRLCAIALGGRRGALGPFGTSLLGARPTVCDPSCGGGAFLLAAARALHASGLPRARVVSELVWGLDRDPAAVAVSELALVLWSGTTPGEHLGVADTLTAGDEAWPAAPPAGFDAVVGNPPFQNQRERASARTAADHAALRARYGDAVGPYADTAALFLLAAMGLARPGGRVVLVQPQSTLSSRDAAAVRRAVLGRATLEGLWVAGEPVFGAATLVCAPVLRVAGSTGAAPALGAAPAPAPVPASATVALWAGRSVRPVRPAAVSVEDLGRWPTWSPLAATTGGTPEVDLDAGPGRLGDHAGATAGFRDQFYGLAGVAVDRRDADDERLLPRLVTCGLLDAGWCAWGERAARFARRSWSAPRVDRDALARAGEGTLGRWVEARLRPKILVATQTRVVEAAVDRHGAWVPSTPVLSVEPAPGWLWRLGAVLLAPPVSAWALRAYGGAALGADTIKLSARQVLEIPLPRRRGPWAEATVALRELAACTDGASRRDRLVAMGATMTDAYGCDEDVLRWWEARLPGRG